MMKTDNLSGLKAKASMFQEMHRRNGMFLLPNAWDAASARIFERAGFPAVATTSAGIAYSLGLPDGEHVPFDDLLFLVKRISGRISAPLSVDFERGYSEDPEQVGKNALRLLEAGAVGFNLEDGQADGRLSPVSLQLEKIHALKELKREAGVDFVINARTCAYWLNVAGETEKRDIAIARGNAFAEAGADCVFVPGTIGREAVDELVKGIRAPLNIILNGAFHDLAELEAMGVRRLSVGSGPIRHILEQTIRMADKLHAGDVSPILGCSFNSAMANKYFGD